MSDRGVFINCPFSTDYRKFFEAIVYTVVRSGFTPRCAREVDDSGEVRFEKICRIIDDSPYGIHDISKTEPDPGSGLPRFNMPLELGLFLGARKFGGKKHSQKKSLVLDSELYRYQKFISDIAGQDIHSHNGEVSQLIGEIANWLRDKAHDPKVPGGRVIADEFTRFRADLPGIAKSMRLELDEVTFKDLANIAGEWIVADSGAE
ncbi:MAG: hypothetical protein WBS22_02630 [Methylocystis sp.]